MTLLLTDGDLDSVAPGDAVAWMLEALQLRASGALSSPPRVHASLVSGKIVMTAGQTATHYGYRVYDTLPTTAGQQIVAVHDASSGDIAAVHVGNKLGAMRTGALGGVAASLLGPQGPAHNAQTFSCCSFDNPAMTPTIPYRWWCVDRLNSPPFLRHSAAIDPLTLRAHVGVSVPAHPGLAEGFARGGCGRSAQLGPAGGEAGRRSLRR